MRALVYTAPYHVELRDVPDPRPATDDVVIEVTLCGICGSDVHGFEGRSAIRIPPTIMGHEFVGRVAGVGPGAPGLQTGQRIVVQPVVGCGTCPLCLSGRPNICPSRRLIGAHLPGGFAEQVAVPRRSIYPIPAAMSDEAGALVEPLANAVHMVRKGPETARECVVIIGAGTLGVLTAATARSAGFERIVVVDIKAERLAVASRLGATRAIHGSGSEAVREILDITGGAGLVIEAVGVEETRQTAIEVARPGGTVVLLGNAQPFSRVPMNHVVNRELILMGSYSSTEAEFRTAISLLAEGAIETDSWTTVLPLEDGPAVFAALDRGEEQSKVLLHL